jgi:hypothetical protein
MFMLHAHKRACNTLITFTLYTASQLERDEWVHVMRKHAVNSNIDNGYEIRRDDKDGKLGSGERLESPVRE